jgi:hypothetical protein
VYGFGLNETEAGEKKGRSEVEVEFKRRFRGRVAFVDDVALNDSEAVRVDRASNMADDCDSVWIKERLYLGPHTTLTV